MALESLFQMISGRKYKKQLKFHKNFREIQGNLIPARAMQREGLQCARQQSVNEINKIQSNNQ